MDWSTDCSIDAPVVILRLHGGQDTIFEFFKRLTSVQKPELFIVRERKEVFLCRNCVPSQVRWKGKFLITGKIQYYHLKISLMKKYQSYAAIHNFLSENNYQNKTHDM